MQKNRGVGLCGVVCFLILNESETDFADFLPVRVTKSIVQTFILFIDSLLTSMILRERRL